MHELVKFAMRGPRQAVILASFSILVPMMFWYGAAIIGLVTLRKGLTQGLIVFAWTIIPALAWWFSVQDPGALIVLLSTLLMACALRYTVSWQSTLVVGGIISLIAGILTSYIMPDLIDALMDAATPIFQELAEKSQQQYSVDHSGMFRSLMVASFAASFYGMSVGSIFLARSWQSQLFNPGGWREEFHQLRLSPRFLMAILLFVVVAPSIGIDSILAMMIASVPVLVSGFALVHGIVGKKQMGGQWLFGFYLSVVMLFPTVLVLLMFVAMLDSLVNFRSRIQAV